MEVEEEALGEGGEVIKKKKKKKKERKRDAKQSMERGQRRE
jgi:hypothetical protein